MRVGAVPLLVSLCESQSVGAMADAPTEPLLALHDNTTLFTSAPHAHKKPSRVPGKCVYGLVTPHVPAHATRQREKQDTELSRMSLP